MQTFLPELTFEASASALDSRRLGKQRMETYQILRTLTGKSDSWKNHPAVKMWRGYEVALCAYGLVVCEEWRYNRGYKDTCWSKIYNIEREFDGQPYVTPLWYNSDLVESHRSNLIRKNPEFYKPKWPDTKENLPYIWPIWGKIEK